MSNTLEAIFRLISDPIVDVRDVYKSSNRANSLGGALEEYVKDLYANTLKERNDSKRLQAHNNCFSYLGNSRNIPDLMLCGGDAIEVKKLETPSSDISLNSSYPKAKLFATGPGLCKAAVNCETWSIKDLLYVIAYTPKSSEKLRRIWLIYGDCFIADETVYQGLVTNLKKGISKIPKLSFSATKELGRINQVDPLKKTSLRIRPMWILQHPAKVFSSLNLVNTSAQFQMIAVMRETKFKSFPKPDRDKLVNFKANLGYNISSVKIPDPDAPTKSINAKIINYYQ